MRGTQKKKVLGVSSTGKRILMTSAMMTMVRENAVPLCAWPNAGANLLLFLSPVRFPRCLPPTPPAHSAPAARPVTSAMTPRPSHHPPPRSRHVDGLRARLAVREASPSPDAAHYWTPASLPRSLAHCRPASPESRASPRSSNSVVQRF